MRGMPGVQDRGSVQWAERTSWSMDVGRSALTAPAPGQRPPATAPCLAITGTCQPGCSLAAIHPWLWEGGRQCGCRLLSSPRPLTPQGVPARHQPVRSDLDGDVPEQQQLRAAGEGLPVPCEGWGDREGTQPVPRFCGLPPGPSCHPAWHSSLCFLCSFGTTISTWPWLSSPRTLCSWRTSPRPSATASWPSESPSSALALPGPTACRHRLGAELCISASGSCPSLMPHSGILG